MVSAAEELDLKFCLPFNNLNLNSHIWLVASALGSMVQNMIHSYQRILVVHVLLHTMEPCIDSRDWEVGFLN